MAGRMMVSSCNALDIGLPIRLLVRVDHSRSVVQSAVYAESLLTIPNLAITRSWNRC